MKKIILTIALFASVAVALAQTKTSKIVATNVHTINQGAQNIINDDTLQRIQSYKDMTLRAGVISNLIYWITKPGDVTPNQGQGILKLADSVLKVDVNLLKKVEALKKPVKQ